MDNFRSIIATKILSNIPPRVKPIDYLMETLNISRESVYRRIRGDISFTLEEISKLSVELNFSIDELVISEMHSRIFFDLPINPKQSLPDAFITIFQEYFQDIFNMSNVKDIESIMVSNHVPFPFVIYFNHLFKFFYYQWMHQNQESSLKYFYSDVILPDELVRLQQKAIEGSNKIRSNTFIFDSNVFFNLIQKIQYYYKRRLINDSDYSLLRNDLSKMIDMVESIAQTGFCNAKSKCSFYISSLNVEASSRYIKYDKQATSQFFVNSFEPLVITNPNLCAIHKKWLDSLRKYSTLITQSNEILQVRYFNKQRSYLEDNIVNTSSIISI